MYAFSDVFLIKYGEIALRGKNRAIYENMLIAALRRNLAARGEHGLNVYREQGRFVAEGAVSNFDAALSALTDTFGVSYVCHGLKSTDQSLDALKAAALRVMETYGAPTTFKVDTTRAVKSYPLRSNDISAAVGEYILDNAPGWSVRMKGADVRLRVELRTDAFVYAGQYDGLSGLPPNSNGRGVLLLSGGFDSPVAGFLAAKRGVGLNCAYFESPPYTSERALQKVKDLAARLAYFTGGVKLYAVPFTDTQLYLRDNAPEKKMTLLLKRAMLRAATKIARAEGAQMLVTGDSVGQVASQTAHALAAVESATSLPIIRPVCCMDKREIIALAQKIGTHDISVLPYEDCCTLFVPEHPETKPKTNIIESVERDLDAGGLYEMITEAVRKADIYKFGH